MSPHPDEARPRSSAEDTAAKWLNVSMIGVLGFAFLAFTAWVTFHDTILLIQAAPDQRWPDVERLIADVGLALAMLGSALGWRFRIKA